MSRDRKTLQRAFALGLLAGASTAHAADLPLKAPALKSVYDWTGFYVGGHFGYGGGSLGPNTNPLPEQGVLFPTSVTGVIGGYQVGYNRELANRIVLGVEADSTFTAPLDQAALGRMPPVPFNSTIDYVGTARGRIGYAFDRIMPYLTGGFAWGHTRALINDGSGASVGYTQFGWTAGAGFEFAVSGNWSAKLEYEYVDLNRQRYDLSGFLLPGVVMDPRIHLLKFGLNYHLSDAPWTPTPHAPLLPESDIWNVHAQTTFLPQGYPSFRSPYAGPNSLTGGSQLQSTWTSTAFLGMRLWQGGEI